MKLSLGGYHLFASRTQLYALASLKNNEPHSVELIFFGSLSHYFMFFIWKFPGRNVGRWVIPLPIITLALDDAQLYTLLALENKIQKIEFSQM